MLICAFHPHYQLVYINFDISSFSLISYDVTYMQIQLYLHLNTIVLAHKYYNREAV